MERFTRFNPLLFLFLSFLLLQGGCEAEKNKGSNVPAGVGSKNENKSVEGTPSAKNSGENGPGVKEVNQLSEELSSTGLKEAASTPEQKKEPAAGAVLSDENTGKEGVKPSSETPSKEENKTEELGEDEIDFSKIKPLTEEELIEREKKELAEFVKQLGEPLLPKDTKLVRLQPDRPEWIDSTNKQVVIIGAVCQKTAPLEMLVCPYKTKEHESILSSPVIAEHIHAALIAVGATPGKPAQFNPVFVPPTGTKIEITFLWADKDQQIQKARAQDWVVNIGSGKKLDLDWVFSGSAFVEDSMSGKKSYMAERGTFICVSNFSGSMLDLPFQSTASDSDLLFKANTEAIPPLGTPVTVLLKPVLSAQEEKKGSSEEDKVSSKPDTPSSEETGKESPMPQTEPVTEPETPPAP